MFVLHYFVINFKRYTVDSLYLDFAIDQKKDRHRESSRVFTCICNCRFFNADWAIETAESATAGERARTGDMERIRAIRDGDVERLLFTRRPPPNELGAELVMKESSWSSIKSSSS